MAERIIQTADLSNILGSLRNLQGDIGTVSDQVGSVGRELNQTREELSRLEQAFADFVASDLKAKELALAETRQVKVRQELDTTYEYYGVVRRQATGILQASDIQLVRTETLRSATEELMISAPRYWLAPALVALSAWLGDNRALAERALAEAIRRDDEKTSLFFALIARRAGRNELNRTWLDRYFGLQNPFKLDRQTVIMVDALANGVFGADVALHCSKRITDWIDELSAQAGFVEAQRTQWGRALLSKAPNDDHGNRYSHLKRMSPTWPELNRAINGVAMHAAVLAHFEGVFQGEIRPAASVLVAVDDLLSKLVTRFDDEELPLRRQEELCRLIIEEGGDRRAAQNRFDLQSAALDEEVDFTQLLTNAAMHPEVSHVTRATQRFAVAHSRDWILDGHADVTAKARMAVPADVHLEIEGWQGVTQDGANEADLLRSLEDEIAARQARDLAVIKFSAKHWLGVALSAALILGAVSAGIVPLLLGGAGLLWACLSHRQMEAKRAQVKAHYAKLRQQAGDALRACLAEVVELRRDIAIRDDVSARVTQLLEGISPEQHVLSSHDSVRRVMLKA
ncbi:hypothetical protein [Achromobacter mucicolens]|uniref:hypothetical protein n=1 Tax=Achromobacter mucicolens TaxID=1389922 RepID=UPI0022F3CC45|nr:hypothetical protein [Achromobacter mucicolens]WBX88290.1 hypothetical protein PE062_23200 [Achromobacter mucicolens]